MVDTTIDREDEFSLAVHSNRDQTWFSAMLFHKYSGHGGVNSVEEKYDMNFCDDNHHHRHHGGDCDNDFDVDDCQFGWAAWIG